MTTTHHTLLFEACVETLEEALIAQRRGAHRIELCSALDQDGLTPSMELTRLCVEQLSIPVMAMVRPRGGDFVYSESEVRQMESEIAFFKQAGVAGVVFGLLTKEGGIDIENTLRLARLALPLEVTFHKAIDCSANIYVAFKELNTIEGITRVLSSGGKDMAWNGRDLLKQMQEMPGRTTRIIAAGKVTPENRRLIADYTGITELHGKRIV
ncbi:MAG TPA: copper homeostasis protein CutC [Prolixibacteraceae bacterium]|jgi:copper homeostasis protein|nr:copper homeostasis protein CutC [Prolixibacteraceae bacterium]